MVSNVEDCSKCFSLDMTPMDFDILLAILFVWSCHLRVSETLKPRKSKHVTFSIGKSKSKKILFIVGTL